MYVTILLQFIYFYECRKDYENMVEGVKKLEGDTKSWREIIEWPQIEMPFKPDNVSMLVMKEPNFPGIPIYKLYQLV